MQTRLAQIVASAVRPDGTVDRTKIYLDLSLTPDAPEAFLVEAVISAEESIASLKQSQIAVVAAAQDAIRSEVATFGNALATHRAIVEEDAKSRRRWLALAIALPSVVTIITFFWFTFS
jgi:hypothetical protein